MAEADSTCKALLKRFVYVRRWPIASMNRAEYLHLDGAEILQGLHFCSVAACRRMYVECAVVALCIPTERIY